MEVNDFHFTFLMLVVGDKTQLDRAVKLNSFKLSMLVSTEMAYFVFQNLATHVHFILISPLY